MKAFLRVTAAVAAVSLIVMGCTRAVSKPEPEPEPEPPAAALTLQGTWAWEESYVDDEDGRTYAEVEVLTFTGGGRAISYNAVYDDTGARIDEWQNGSGWSATDTTATRTWYDDDDDDDETPEEKRELEKSYYWGEDRQSVFLNPWGWGEATDTVHRYTRVADPLSNLIGPTWTWRRNEGAYTLAVTLTFNADGTFVWASVRPDGLLTFSGTYDLDLETLTALPSDMTRSRTPADGGKSSTEAFLPDFLYQFAFAATDSPTTILVSPPHLDQDAPYGDYRDWYYIATP